MKGTSSTDLTGAQLVAVARVGLRVEPTDALRKAARRAGRPLVDVGGGDAILGWDSLTDGVWFGDGMDQLRAAREPSKRLGGVMAACLRCCWPDTTKPLYPGVAAPQADVLAAYATLGTGEGGASEVMSSRHALGALVTLEAGGLIERDIESSTVRLGPVVATWPDKDVELLRAHWHRLPTPPARQEV